MIEKDDVEQLADALLDAVEEDAAATAPDTKVPDVLTTAALAFRRLGIDFVRRYNRLDVDADASTFDGCSLSPTTDSAGSSTSTS